MTIRKTDVIKMLMAARAAGLIVERLEADFRADKVIVHVERAEPEQLAALNGHDQPQIPAISDAHDELVEPAQ